MVFCGNCGAQNPDTSKFCSKCGSALQVTAEAQMPKEASKTMQAQAPIMEKSAEILAFKSEFSHDYFHNVAAEKERKKPRFLSKDEEDIEFSSYLYIPYAEIKYTYAVEEGILRKSISEHEKTTVISGNPKALMTCEYTVKGELPGMPTPPEAPRIKVYFQAMRDKNETGRILNLIQSGKSEKLDTKRGDIVIVEASMNSSNSIRNIIYEEIAANLNNVRDAERRSGQAYSMKRSYIKVLENILNVSISQSEMFLDTFKPERFRYHYYPLYVVCYKSKKGTKRWVVFDGITGKKDEHWMETFIKSEYLRDVVKDQMKIEF